MVKYRKKVSAKRKMNTILITFGVGAILIMVISFGIIIKNQLGASIEQNVISDLKGSTDKLDTHNAGCDERNKQLITSTEIYLNSHGGIFQMQRKNFGSNIMEIPPVHSSFSSSSIKAS